MLKRKIDDYIRNYFNTTDSALLITGARQIGKTYSIRQFGKLFKSFVEINFVDMPQAIHIDNRMQNWSKNTLNKDGIFDQRLRTVRYDQPPYSTAYPLLPDYWEGDPSFPRNNQIAGNLFYKVKNVLAGAWSYADWWNNFIARKNPGFKNEENILEGWVDNAPVFDRIEHFQPIPFEKIGFQRDKLTP